MRFFDALVDRIAIAGEFLAFLWDRKLWWMIPLVTVLLFFGIIIAFGSATGAGPVIYTLF